jgi:hypothetical protein
MLAFSLFGEAYAPILTVLYVSKWVKNIKYGKGIS